MNNLYRNIISERLRAKTLFVLGIYKSLFEKVFVWLCVPDSYRDFEELCGIIFICCFTEYHEEDTELLKEKSD